MDSIKYGNLMEYEKIVCPPLFLQNKKKAVLRRFAKKFELD